MANTTRPDAGQGGSVPPAREAIRFLGTTLVVAAVLAAAFTAWTPASLLPGDLSQRLVALVGGAVEATPEGSWGVAGANLGLRVGVVVGHLGPHPETGLVDPGSVCPDGLTELEVNQAIASIVAHDLEEAGLRVDLLEEFDARLTEYRAAALVSVHADSCSWINAQATGYKVSGALDATVPERTQRLVNCLVDRYGRVTGLDFHAGSITRDMTQYHTFYEIHNQTPAAIIETGFLYLDRDYLTQHPDEAARGIVDGILCFLNNEPVSLPAEGRP